MCAHALEHANVLVSAVALMRASYVENSHVHHKHEHSTHACALCCCVMVFVLQRALTFLTGMSFRTPPTLLTPALTCVGVFVKHHASKAPALIRESARAVSLNAFNGHDICGTFVIRTKTPPQRLFAGFECSSNH